MSSPRLRRLGTGLLLLLLAAGLWAVAAWLRLRALDQAVVSSDSLGPYLQALGLTWEKAQAGVFPRPPNPESGDWLWLSMVPLVHGATSLQELFSLRFGAGAAVAPLGALAAFVWSAPEDGVELLEAPLRRQWVAALVAGIVLALDPGLTDSLVSGARSYGAPELAAAVTLLLGLAWRGRPWPALFTAAVLVVAAGHHPMAAGLGLGVALLLPGLGERLDLSDLAVAAGVGLVFALPRILRLVGLLQCGEDPLTCLSAVAQSNVAADVDLAAMVERALHDRLLVDLHLWVAAGLGLGLLLCRPWTGIGAFALGSLAGMVGLGIVTAYLQSYHLRILAAPMVVAAAVGLARLWPLALVWAGVAGVTLFADLPAGPDPGAAARHDALAEVARAPTPGVAGALWVDRALWGSQVALEPGGVVLSAVLGGADRADFRLHPDARMLLLVVGADAPPAPAGAVAAEGTTTGGTPWAALRFDRPAAARAWVDAAPVPPHQVGGAMDWAGPLAERPLPLETASW